MGAAGRTCRPPERCRRRWSKTVAQGMRDLCDVNGFVVNYKQFPPIPSSARSFSRRYRQPILACLLALLGLLLPAVEGRTQDLASDKAALEALYNDTGGANWTNNTNWLSSEPVGTWHGVTVTGGRVTDLQLSNNQLTGSIPAELGNLASLLGLYLHNNQLMGSIPSQLGNLTSLTGLGLDNNRLTGSIPSQLGNLTSLTVLGLDSNQLTGSIPAELGSLASLALLDLNNNQLTGSIPAELGNLASLLGLYLHNNQLMGSIPAELGSHANLRILDLHNNQLTGSIPAELGTHANLAILDLHNNQLTGSIPAELGNLASLWRLNLHNNQLTGSIPGQLGNLTRLAELDLHNNHLTGSLPPSLANLGALRLFSFYGNTALTVPADPALQTWLGGIIDVRGHDYVPPAHFVPVILTSSGRNNSFFTSELTLTNRERWTETLNYTYTAAAGGGSGQARETLAAGRQKIVPNAIDYLRTLGVPIPPDGNRIGTLRVEIDASDSEVAVTARTTTRVADGLAGLAYPGVAVADGFTNVVYLCGLRQNAQDRSNVAFQNMGASQGSSITLRTTLFSTDSAAPGSRVLPEVKLAPGGFHQYSGLLAGAGFAEGYVKVEWVSGQAPFYAYGVINDQANSDGSFVFPVTAGSLVGVRGQTLPVIIEHPNFTTEVIVTNFSDSAKEFDVHFVAEAIATSDNTASLTGQRIAPGAQWIIPDFVQQTLRAGGASGIGPRGRTIAGAAFFEAAGGDDLSGVVIAARTGSRGGGGQYSVFYNAVPYGAAFNETAWVYALQQNAENRSNLALVNTGEVDGSDSVFELEIYDGETGRLVNTVTGIRVPARGWRQINGILGNYAPGTTQGYVRVRKTAGTDPFLAYGVVNDGGAPGQRSGDGAYVPGQ